MKKRIIPLLLALALVLTGCGGGSSTDTDNARLRVVTTTYPIYLLASAVTEGVDGVAVERLDTGSASCLHDYTLSVNDMKKLEGADVIALNGAGLEDFMDDALAASDAAGHRLLGGGGAAGKSGPLPPGGGRGRPRPRPLGPPLSGWTPARGQMAENLAQGLTQADPDYGGLSGQAAGRPAAARLGRRALDGLWTPGGRAWNSRTDHLPRRVPVLCQGL
ncbi:MAG: zinc ABC transporter substrate-binding protein [Lawsonibacter sp.]